MTKKVFLPGNAGWSCLLLALGAATATSARAAADAAQLAYTSSAPTGGPDQNASTTEATPPETYSVHGQVTNVTQFHPRFASPFRGPNSLDPGNRGNETVDAT